MKLPRDISATDLIKALKKYHYISTRQSGSHIRLTTQEKGEHHLTIPNHDPIKIGTLSAILQSVAEHLNKSKEEIINELF
ncbi:MAG: type II toxin-antitoxin system HicA family toxin [Cytophagia bacterium]|nr:type II toxin-antitoxin system HicA family toxin [Cytophagia bacterium]